MGPAVVGTIVITGMATLMAVPLGILGAIYLNEYGATGRLPKILRFFADVMTGVPSIIMGLFISAIWVVRFGTDGVTGFAGALALGCLMLPIVIRSTEEMLRLVPGPPARGELRPRRRQGAHDPHGRPAAGVPRHPQRRAARRRPRRRRDRAAAVHHRCGHAR